MQFYFKGFPDRILFQVYFSFQEFIPLNVSTVFIVFYTDTHSVLEFLQGFIYLFN